MRTSSPEDADQQHGHRISGVAVVVALLLLVAGGAGLSIAMYFVIPPVPAARLNAVAKQGRTPVTVSDDAQAASAVQPPASWPAGAGRTNSQTAPEAPATGSQTPESSPGISPDSGQSRHDVGLGSARKREKANEIPVLEPAGNSSGRPQELRQRGFDLVTLPPIEIEADAASQDAWRRSVKMGGRDYERAVRLRPAANQGLVQIAFQLDGRFVHLRGVAGIADLSSPSQGGAGQDQPQAVFRVYGDGNLLWESKTLAGPGDHQAFECPVAGVDVLAFAAESQSPANISDLAWGGLALFPREKK